VQLEVDVAKRGFFAEINHQAQLTERRRQQQAVVANRAHVAAQREAERALRAAEQARSTALRASVADQKAAQQEAARLLLGSRMAEVEARNADLADKYSEIDSMLATTFAVDNFVDLEELRVATVDHPPFDAGGLDRPTPQLPALGYPPEPAWQEPAAPRGLSGAFGGMKRHEEHVVQARAQYDEACRAWHEQATAMHAEYLTRVTERESAETKRLQGRVLALARYDEECRRREQDAAAHNAELDRFINDLAFDVESAIQDYVGMVLSNSLYPDVFPVTHDHHFDLATRELTLTATVPAPSNLPTVREYKYAKATDEITATALPAREQKDRYANAVWQVAVRTLHEVFEADRAGRVHSISLAVVSDHIAPYSGLPESVPLVVVGADRDTFTAFDLTNVVPHATLAHLGAAMSKSPFDLTAADTSHGVRARGR
jgi:restriction system protein